jgi:hypothetical protein
MGSTPFGPSLGPLPPWQGQGLSQRNMYGYVGLTDLQNAYNSQMGQTNALAPSETPFLGSVTGPRMVPNRTCRYCGNHTVERRCESCGAPR